MVKFTYVDFLFTYNVHTGIHIEIIECYKTTIVNTETADLTDNKIQLNK